MIRLPIITSGQSVPCTPVGVPPRTHRRHIHNKSGVSPGAVEDAFKLRFDGSKKCIEAEVGTICIHLVVPVDSLEAVKVGTETAGKQTNDGYG